MAFNGTGTFVRLYNWVTDKTNSVPITASRTDSEMDGFATGLSNCITKDGQTVLTADIPMASHKLTGLSVGSARTDSISVGQVQDGQFTALGTTGGVADAYTASPSPAITAYVATMRYSAKINATNLTTIPYLQLSSIASPANTAVIKKHNSAGAEIAVEDGDLLFGKIYHFDRNPTNDSWIVLNPEKPYIVGVNFSSVTSQKNAIINGDFNIWQRGTTFSSIADSAYSSDRWVYQKAGAMVHDISRSTDVPTLAQAKRLFNYSLLADCTTADTSIAAGDYALIRQKIEGYNFLPLAQKIITFSFWVKATKTGIYCVFASNSVPDRSYVGEYTINTTSTWEYKTVTLAASPSAGTWDYTNGVGLNIGFCLAAGSTFQTTAGAWQTGNFHATSNQVNACDNASNDFRIVGVQLEVGSVATSFEQKTFNEQLFLCQRYYEKNLNSDTGGLGNALVNPAFTTSSIGGGKFKVEKRAAPTIVISSRNNTNGKVSSAASGADVGTTVTAQTAGVNGWDVTKDSGIGFIVGTVGYEAFYTANSEL